MMRSLAHLPHTHIHTHTQGKEIHPWQGLKLMSLPATGTLLIMTLVLEYPTMAAKRAGEISPQGMV